MKLLIADSTVDLGIPRHIQCAVHPDIPIEPIFTAMRIEEALLNACIEAQGMAAPIGVNFNTRCQFSDEIALGVGVGRIDVVIIFPGHTRLRENSKAAGMNANSVISRSRPIAHIHTRIGHLEGGIAINCIGGICSARPY